MARSGLIPHPAGWGQVGEQPSASPTGEAIAPPLAFGCPACRIWSAIAESALGTELPCPSCGEAVKLNEFVVEADWRPVSAAWRGESLDREERFRHAQ